ASVSSEEVVCKNDLFISKSSKTAAERTTEGWEENDGRKRTHTRKLPNDKAQSKMKTSSSAMYFRRWLASFLASRRRWAQEMLRKSDKTLVAKKKVTFNLEVSDSPRREARTAKPNASRSQSALRQPQDDKH
ncbi:unnamed protein product, partial [Amoebophrya sp. A120]